MADVILYAPNFNQNANPTITYSLYGLVEPNVGYIKSAEIGLFPANVGAFPESERLAFIPFKPLGVSNSTYQFVIDPIVRQNLINACTGKEMKIRFYIRYYLVITDISGVVEGYFYEYAERTFSLTDAEPIVNGTVIETDDDMIALTGSANKLIRYHNSAQATITSAEAKFDAAIDGDMYVIRNGNKIRYGESVIIENAEEKIFTFSAQDSRGFVGRYDLTADMVEYIKPTCGIKNKRPDAMGNMTLSCSGAYFNNTFGVVENTLSVQYRYGITGGSFSDWTDMNFNIASTNTNYYADVEFTIPDFNQNQYYSFEIKVKDKLETITASISGLKCMPMFHWGENDFTFEVPVAFNAGISNMPEFEKGTWEPYLELISSYTAQNGWYSKIGNAVTIGFYIKGNCYQGFENTDIVIHGLPYTPLYSAAGGGMCSGVYVSGGFNFQCFVAETNQTITIRVQSCNNTSETNLSTSASGCKYRSGGGQITLSGTITYIGY